MPFLRNRVNCMGVWREKCRSIVVRMIALASILVAAGFLIQFFMLSAFLRGEVEAVSSAHQLSIATYVANDVDEKIRSRLALLERIAADIPPEQLSDPRALLTRLSSLHNAFPVFSKGMAIVPLGGVGVIAEFPTVPGRASFDYRQSRWFLTARQGHTAVIGRPVRSPLSGEPMIAMATTIRDRNGAPAAVLVGATAIAAPGFLNLVQESRVGRTGGFLLISPEERLHLVGNTPELVLSPLPAPGTSPLHDRAMAGFRGTGVTTSAAGVEELVAVASVPTPDWFLVARLPTEEAFAAIGDLHRLLSVYSTVTLVAVIALLLVILNRVVRPLTQASTQMHRMAEGREELAPLPIRDRDEVGELARGFNFLLGRLRQQESALRESEAHMAHIAHHDALTGLPNRVVFHDRLRQAIARARRDGGQFALLYIDLDRFKPVNDTYGHSAGDDVLRTVAVRLTGLLRQADTVARIGGDEFAVLLMETRDARAAAETVVGKCRDALAEPIRLDGIAIQIGLSVGIAVYPADGHDDSQLLSFADRAMYSAKRRSQPAGALS